MKKILKEILIFLIAILIVGIVFGYKFGNDIFRTGTIDINVGDTYYVMSLYFYSFPFVIFILFLIYYVRTVIEKFEISFLNWSTLIFSFLLILSFPLIFELYNRITEKSFQKFNSIYLFLQITYIIILISGLYISYRIGKKKHYA